MRRGASSCVELLAAIVRTEVSMAVRLRTTRRARRPFSLLPSGKWVKREPKKAEARRAVPHPNLSGAVIAESLTRSTRRREANDSNQLMRTTQRSALYAARRGRRCQIAARASEGCNPVIAWSSGDPRRSVSGSCRLGTGGHQTRSCDHDCASAISPEPRPLGSSAGNQAGSHSPRDSS